MTKLPKEANYCNTEPISVNDFGSANEKESNKNLWQIEKLHERGSRTN